MATVSLVGILHKEDEPGLVDPPDPHGLPSGLAVRRAPGRAVEHAPRKGPGRGPRVPGEAEGAGVPRYVYADSDSLIGKSFPKEAYRSVAIFFSAILVVVVLGTSTALRPKFPTGKGGAAEPLSMNLVIQMIMLLAGAVILLTCKVDGSKINRGPVYRSGMTAIFSVFGVAWMTETFMGAHIKALESSLSRIMSDYPWTYAIILFVVGKLVNSQAAALLVIAPLGLQLGVDPVTLVGFYGAAYGYFVLPTYPSDLAAIGFDRTGTTHIGKYIINHSFLVPGFICVITSCLVGTGLAHILLGG